MNTPLSDKVSRHTLEACDWKGLLELIARIRTRVMALNRPVEVVSCYEGRNHNQVSSIMTERALGLPALLMP